MFGKRIPILTLYGFEVAVDASWFLLAVLVTWSLAAGYFPALYPELSVTTSWLMGAAGAVGLFASIVVHELAHSLVARRHGLPIGSITLFLFGGVAHMDKEPPNPRSEFLMAGAGPLTSLGVAALAYGVHVGAQAAGAPRAVVGVIGYLALINVVVAVFNLIPAFPLDGGRMLRAALWAWKGRLDWATRIAATPGSWLGLALILLGLYQMIVGNFIGGLWWALIGLFVRAAAGSAYRTTMTRRMLEGVTVADLMTRDCPTASPDLSVAALVEDYIYRHHHKSFPVTDAGRVVGCVTLRDVSALDRAAWPTTTVGAVMRPCGDLMVAPDLPAADAVALLARDVTAGLPLVVAEDGRFRGILSRRDLFDHVSTRLELEDDSPRRRPRRPARPGREQPAPSSP